MKVRLFENTHAIEMELDVIPREGDAIYLYREGPDHYRGKFKVVSVNWSITTGIH